MKRRDGDDGDGPPPGETGSEAAPDVSGQTFHLLAPSAASGGSAGAPSAGASGTPGGRRAAPVFAPGELGAGRFRIVRFLAQGGMGQVYEADDLELHESVALKTVRSETSDERTLARFKREIHLARRVTHPNVCRTFDVFRHQPEDGPATLVLAMELLRGETLAARIRRAGPLAPAEALPLARQMAEALAAAHRAGVVHRDFNPKNVMLVPSPEGTRAVVTDFGLALAHADERPRSETGFAAGTPAYMAPEQVAGDEVTVAADVYAFGVVLFEMVTGRWPFQGDSPVATAVKRLQEAPPSPRLHVPDLDPHWEAAILRCLARSPAARFAEARDAVRALEPPAPRRAHNRAALAGVAVLALVLLALAVQGLRSWLGRPGGPGAVARPAVAVLGFQNLSGRPESAWLSTAFAEMLTTELAAGQGLRAIPGETVARAKTELALPEARSLAPATLRRLRGLLAADYVVVGSYSAPGGPAGRLRLDVLLQDAAGGETVAAVAETGSEAELFELVARTGAALREELGMADLSARERRGTRAARPADPRSARLYAEGLARLRAADFPAARDRLRAAVAAQPGFPLAHAALARAWAEMGYDGRAAAAAERAFELSGDLAREDRLLVEGQYREATNAWPRAVDIYRTLWGFFPDNLEYGLRLARAETAAGMPAAALETVAELRALPAPHAGDPRIDLAEAEAARALSDSERQLAAARRAAAEARQRGARVLVAEAEMAAGTALRNLGRPVEALAAHAGAAEICRGVGDRACLARALRQQAVTRTDLGELARAERLYREALALARGVGDREGVAAALNNLGIVRRRQGDLEGAARFTREALAVFRELGDRELQARSLVTLANVLAERGDLAAAETAYDEALALKRAIGDEAGAARVLGNLADLRLVQGDIAAARRLFGEALAADRASKDRNGVVTDLLGLGEVALLAGDLAGARARWQEALAEAQGIRHRSLAAWAHEGLGRARLAGGDPAAAERHHRAALRLRTASDEAALAAASRVSLGRVALARGEAAGAERAARQAAAEADENAEVEVAAACLLAESLLAQGRPAQARREVARALEQATAAVPLALRLAAALAQGRAEAAAGDRAAGRQRLAATQHAAAAAGLALVDLEARLELARLDRDPARLAALGDEARRRGHLLLAGRAAAPPG